MHARPKPVLAVLAALSLAAVTGCGGSSSSSDAATTVSVKAGDDSCEVSQTELDAGKTTLDVENVGSDVTEVYVYGKDGEEFNKIMGEKENIGPGTSQSFSVDLAAGDYQVACKPGMTGDGIRTDVTVSGSGGSSEGEESYDRELTYVVAADGSVSSDDAATGEVGERIEFKLENGSDEEHYLVLLDPEGKEVDETEAEGGADAELIAELTAEGTWTVQVHPDGDESAATELPLTVAAAG